MSTDLTLPQVLDAAADVIERNGHHRRAWYAYDPGKAARPPAECAVCVGGALNLVVLGTPRLDISYDDVPMVLLDAYRVMAARHGFNEPPDAYMSVLDEMDDLIQVISNWNDVVGTAELVTAELRAAAAESRAESE